MSTVTAQSEVVTIDDTLPQLEIPAPCCSHCRNDVRMDDGAAWCESCGIVWERIEDGGVGTFDPDHDWDTERDPAGAGPSACGQAPDRPADETLDQGPSTVHRHWAPCILPFAHSSDHLHPMTRTTTIKPQCGEVGGAGIGGLGSPVPAGPCIREYGHPGDHANGARYWR